MPSRMVDKPPNPDPQLEEKLKAEWPAILRWGINGCLDWQKNRLVRPESVKAATSKYFSNQDLWPQWLDEECRVEPDNTWLSGGSSELFDSWGRYAKAGGCDAGSRVEFAERLAELGCSADRTPSKRIWRGISIRSQSVGEP
jgi:putative DNA primase/helicase